MAIEPVSYFRANHDAKVERKVNQNIRKEIERLDEDARDQLRRARRNYNRFWAESTIKPA